MNCLESGAGILEQSMGARNQGGIGWQNRFIVSLKKF